MSKEALQAEASELGIDVDARWGEARLKEEIAKAGKPVNGIDSVLKEMIPKMADAASEDLNRHQIQASIYVRLEKWAEKKGIEDWDSILPKHMGLVKEAADARHEKVQRVRAERARQRRARLAE